MDVTTAANHIDTDLRAAAEPERAEKERRYLKSDLEHYGVTVPALRRVAKAFMKDHPGLGHDDLITLAETLWGGPVHERRMVAVLLLEQYRDVLGPDDLALIERLLRESRTWALVDNLSATVAGPLLDRDPDATCVLDRWAADDDFWIRRSALLAHLIPLRAGGGDFARFGRHADAMLDEKEFFIRKAIGWVLRDTARRRPDLVYEWLAPRAERASGVTVREAVKRLDAEQAEEIMQAYRNRSRSSPPA